MNQTPLLLLLMTAVSVLVSWTSDPDSVSDPGTLGLIWGTNRDIGVGLGLIGWKLGDRGLGLEGNNRMKEE